MYKDKTVAVVITAYNEEDFVGEVIDTLPSFVDRAYVVDDRSTDGTWNEILRHSGVTDGDGRTLGFADSVPDSAPDGGPVIVPIRHEENRGVGGAVKTGYRNALEDGVDAVAVLNGDGQMDPDILDRIIDPVVEGRADYVKGNRLLSRDHTRGMSLWRRFGNGALTYLTKVASGYWKTMDPQNGYTAISRRALSELDIDDLYDDYGFLNDVLVKLNARRMRVADVEMRAVYADESSSISYSSFIPTVSALLLRGFLWRLKVRYLVYDFHPLVVLYAFGGLGGVGALAQLALVALGALPPLSGGTDAFLTLLFGGLCLSLAMAFDLANNEHLESQHLIDDGDVSRARRTSDARLAERRE